MNAWNFRCVSLVLTRASRGKHEGSTSDWSGYGVLALLLILDGTNRIFKDGWDKVRAVLVNLFIKMADPLRLNRTDTQVCPYCRLDCGNEQSVLGTRGVCHYEVP
jgi:hypothetical protein